MEIPNNLVEAKDKNHRTGLILREGKTYRIQATVKAPLIDKKIPCPSADGFTSDLRKKSTQFVMKRMERFRRAPKENWFALIAYTLPQGKKPGKRNRHFFKLIGSTNTYSPERSGELILFLNDLPCMYWNNHGSLQISIEEE